MLVKESQILGESSLNLLDRMQYIAESTMDPYEVPVRYNDRFDKDLIKLEDFCKFAESNAIEDAGVAIAMICESNSIAPNNIGFYVEETSIIADDSIAETAHLIMENGFRVLAAPISHDSLYYRALDEALALDEDCEDFESSPNLLAFCEENVFEKASNKIGQGVDSAKAAVGRGVDKVKSAGKQVKTWATSGVDALSKKYAAAKAKVKEIGSSISRFAGDAKAAAMRQLEKAKAVMKNIGAKLAAAKNSVANKAKSVGNAISDTASSAKKKVFG